MSEWQFNEKAMNIIIDILAKEGVAMCVFGNHR